MVTLQGVIVDDNFSHWYTTTNDDDEDFSWAQPQVGVNYSVDGTDRSQDEFNFAK